MQEVTITLRDDEIKTVLDSLEVNRDLLQREANSLKPRQKRCGITGAGWQKLADDADVMKRRIAHAIGQQEWLRQTGREDLIR